MNAGIIFAAVMDGPNVHFGEHNSVSTRLKIAMTKDFSHCSALAVTHHTKGIAELLRIKQLMTGMAGDFKRSYQKMMEYRLELVNSYSNNDVDWKKNWDFGPNFKHESMKV